MTIPLPATIKHDRGRVLCLFATGTKVFFDWNADAAVWANEQHDLRLGFGGGQVPAHATWWDGRRWTPTDGWRITHLSWTSQQFRAKTETPE